jgi:hypothetical protein
VVAGLSQLHHHVEQTQARPVLPLQQPEVVPQHRTVHTPLCRAERTVDLQFFLRGQACLDFNLENTDDDTPNKRQHAVIIRRALQPACYREECVP